MRAKKIFAVGTNFGDWVLLKELKSITTKGGTSKRTARVRCTCGTVKTVQLDNLIRGASKRCNGCAKKIRAEKIRGPRSPDGVVNQKCAFGRYRQGATKRGLAFELNLETFVKMAKQNCHYCNSPPSNCYNVKHSKGELKGKSRGGAAFIHNGIDRVNSALGYFVENCVPCCKRCNRAKSNMSTKEFYDWITAVYRHTKERFKNGSPVSSRSV